MSEFKSQFEGPLLMRALTAEPLPRPPVWLMRQAGRYLAEYRAIKEKSSFLEMCTNVDLALEVSMQPVRIFDVDAAIVFADILLPLRDMGLHLDFKPGPHIENPVRTADDIKNLGTGVDTTAHVVGDVIGRLRRVLDPRPGFSSNEQVAREESAKAVIGFAGAPWTMCCYALDQGLLKHYAGTVVFARKEAKAFHALMEKITLVTIDYLKAQYLAGAHVVQLFDSWGGILSRADYLEFSLPYNRRIIEALKAVGCPVLLYTGDCLHLLPALVQTGASCLSLDWRLSLAQAEEIIPQETAIQGNLDPTQLFLDPDAVRQQTRLMLASLSRRGMYIANLGHGVLQGTPREGVKAFVDAVKEGWLD